MIKVTPYIQSITGLFSCLMFLICAIVFDLTDMVSAETLVALENDKGAADSRIYFIPLFLAFSTLILNSYLTYKKLGKSHDCLWFSFFMLSVFQTTKSIYFDTYSLSIIGYLYLLVVVAYIFYRVNLFKRVK